MRKLIITAGVVFMALCIGAQAQGKPKHPPQSVSPLIARLAFSWATQIQEADALESYSGDNDGDDDVAFAKLQAIMDEIIQAENFNVRTKGDIEILNMVGTADTFAIHHRQIQTLRLHAALNHIRSHNANPLVIPEVRKVIPDSCISDAIYAAQTRIAIADPRCDSVNAMPAMEAERKTMTDLNDAEFKAVLAR